MRPHQGSINVLIILTALTVANFNNILTVVTLFLTQAQRRREERRLKRAPLDRSNRVREVAAAGNKRAKRCDLMAPSKFSRVVNNRKC